jgi:hypothetical protein
MRHPTAEDARSQPGPDPAPALPSRRDRAPLVLAILSLAVFLLLLVPLFGPPLASTILVPLKMGEVHASEPGPRH